MFAYISTPEYLKLTLKLDHLNFFPTAFLCRGVHVKFSPQKTVNIPSLILTKLTRLTTSVSREQ